MKNNIKNLSYKEKLDWFRLINSENVGPKTFESLLELYGTAGEALERIPEISLRGGRKKAIKVCSLDKAKKEMELCEKYGAEIIALCETNYPEILRHIVDPPPLITVKGNPSVFKKSSVALVGTRHASANACKHASEFANNIGKSGYNIVSGLARGVDTYVHKASVETGTVAVLAGGINNIYPPENRDLYKKISEKGLIVSEMPFNTLPKPHYFPRRNRIISGISIATVVIEAALNSGSLITASFALDQGRDVFAIPGSPADPRSAGCNHLIKKGAYVAEDARDVLDVVNADTINKLNEVSCSDFENLKLNNIKDFDTDEVRSDIISKLTTDPALADDIISSSGLSPAIVLAVLLELELAERVQRVEGNKFCLKYKVSEDDLSDIFFEIERNL